MRSIDMGLCFRVPLNAKHKGVIVMLYGADDAIRCNSRDRQIGPDRVDTLMVP